MDSTANSTKVNVDIGASGSYKGVVQGAMKDFSDLWGKVGEGKIATGIAVAGFAGLAIGISASVKAAANFQQQTTTLVTTAGETEKNLKMVRDGIMSIASSTGTSLQELSAGAYTIESAGYHGRDALIILQAAAQGAKTENADLGKVTDAVTSAMIDYHEPVSQASNVTSKLVAAVGQGKSTFEGFTGALHSVLPVASAAKVSMDDVLGSIASMTVHGMSADQATQNLAHAIGKMMSPTQGMTNELAALNIKSSDLNDMLGTKGISGTLETISQAIVSKMGPAGKVMLDAFNGNKIQAADMMTMLSAMSPKLQDMAKAYTDGSISLKEFRLAEKGLPTDQANLMNQYIALSNRAHGFSAALKSGINTSQSYSQALQAATGDVTTMNTALMLTGENAKYTTSAVKAVGAAHSEAGGNVAGWALVQKNFNQQLSEAREHFRVLIVQIGNVFLPMLTTVLKVFASLMDNKLGLVAIVGAVTLLGLAMMKYFTTSMVNNVKGIGTSLLGIKAPALEAASAIGSEGSTMGIVGALGALGPAGILAGITLGGVTALTVSHWSTIKGVIDDIGKSISSVGSHAANIPSFNIGQSKNAIAGAVPTIKSDVASDLNLTKQLTDQTNTLTGAKQKLASYTDQYNRAVEQAVADYTKYGPNSKQEQNDLATIAKLSSQMADAQTKVNSAQNAVNDTTKKLSANNQALSETVNGVKKAMDNLPAAHEQVKVAQNLVSDSALNVTNKQKDLNTSQLLFSNITGPGAVSAHDQIRKASDSLVGALKDGKKHTDDLGAAHDNMTTALKTAKYWTDQHDQKVKDLGLDAKHTKDLIDDLNSSLSKTSTPSGGFWNSFKGLFHFASGVQNFGGGAALVGEEGPELVYLPPGSSVIPNRQTNQIMGGQSSNTVNNSGGNTQHVTVNVYNPNAGAMQQIFQKFNQDSINAGRGLSAVQGAY